MRRIWLCCRVSLKDKVKYSDGDMEKTTRIDFGELQFGRDYEIK